MSLKLSQVSRTEQNHVPYSRILGLGHACDLLLARLPTLYLHS